MIVKLLTENHLEFLSLTGGCRGSSESTLVIPSNCWKSHTGAHFRFYLLDAFALFAVVFIITPLVCFLSKFMLV